MVYIFPGMLKGFCSPVFGDWGITKLIASLLFTVALPLLLGCLFFAGGLLILVPLGLVALAFGLLKACL